MRPRDLNRAQARLVLAGAALVCLVVAVLVPIGASASPLALCGNPGPAPGPIQHVMVVMLENQSYGTVMNGSSYPYQSTTLAAQCGVATNMYSATHWSAANYLALSGGQFPAVAAKGCGTVAACTTSNDNLFAQADRAGLGWRNYVEGAGPTPGNCLNAKNVPGVTKIGHQPGLFYGLADCPTNVVPVPDTTATSGPLWQDLQGGTLPALSWVTPNQSNVGEGTNPTQVDGWLQRFLALVQGSATYQAGRTAVLVTYDEGSAPDQKVGQDCTNQVKDLARQQESCHLPFFVVSPYTSPASDATFFHHYSVTKTIEDLFDWPHLAHAADPGTASLVGHFGLQAPSAFPTPTPTDTGSDTGTATDPPTDPTDTTTTPTSTATFAPLSSTCGNAPPVSAMPPRHLVVLFMENRSRPAIIGSPSAPYQTSLAATCGQSTNMWAISHPSLPNYVALHSGTFTSGTFHDCVPQPAKGACVSRDENVFHQVDAAGLTWRNYAEDMSTTCQLTNAGLYVPRHNPGIYFTDLEVADAAGTTSCARYDVPMGDVTTQAGRFYDDVRGGNLPSYTFISPNQNNDGHSSSIAAGDAYLSKLVPFLTAGPNYQAGNTDIVITYDEGAGSDKVTDEDCTNQARDAAGLQPSCNVPFLVVAPYEPAGTVSSAFCSLYCLTRTVEGLLGLPLLGHAADPATRDLTAEFNLSPAGPAPG